MNNIVLIATNGFDGTWPAVEYGAWVAGALGAKIRLMAISESSPGESPAQDARLGDLLARAEALLSSSGLSFDLDRRHGRFEELVPRAAGALDAIAVIGPLGRPFLKRLFVGRSIRSLLEAVQTPLLYVPRACLPMRKMLVCLGGLGYEITAEHLALRLAVASGADITLLHVAAPAHLEYPTARMEREHWRDLETTDGLLGRNLRAALEAARGIGVPTSLTARQGDVVEEILGELKSGGYDLVCMGSPYGLHGLRQLYEPHVTDEVAERAACPVLTARYTPESGPADH